MMTPKFPGRPRSLEPAVVLAWRRVVSRACRLFFIWHWCRALVAAVSRCVLMNTHLETLGVHLCFSPFAAASTSTKRAARCCHRSNAPGGLTTPRFSFMHVCSVHVSKAALGRTSKGELGKEWPEANDRPDACPVPVLYDEGLPAHDTTPAQARTLAGSVERGRPRKPGVVTVNHQPSTPQHTQRSLAVTCFATHRKQGTSEPHAMLAKPQQQGNTCDDEGIPTHSATLAGTESNNDLCGVKSQTSLTVFFSRVSKTHTHKFWWIFQCSLAFYTTFAFGPIT